MSNLSLEFYKAFILENRWQFFVEGFVMTMFLTIVCFLLGSLWAGIICYLRLNTKGPLKKTIELINAFFVLIPTLVVLMFFMYVIFKNANTSTVIICVIGLILKNGAYLSEIFLRSVEAVNKGEIEAARALGMNRVQAFLEITFPQAAASALTVYENQFVTCLKETSIVGTLAVTELTKASNIVTGRTLDALIPLTTISIAYLFVGVIGKKVIELINKQKHLKKQ